MKIILFATVILVFYNCQSSHYLQEENVKLSKPVAFVENVFFENSTSLKIDSSVKNSRITYELENGIKAKYIKPVYITESTIIKMYATGGNYITSDTSRIEVIKLPGLKIFSIHSGRNLNDQYGKEGMNILIDRRKGRSDFKHGWLGYLGDTVSYDLQFEEREVKKVIVSTLSDQNAWIFNPVEISVYCNEEPIATINQKGKILQEEKANIFNKINFSGIFTDRLTVKVVAPPEIPYWHPGSGHKPWIFIDEIIVY